MPSTDAETAGTAPSPAGAHDSRPDAVGPLFVGGTGRSGTNVVSHLLGRHSRFFRLPREVTFHTRPRGLPGYVDGTVPREELIESLRDRWWDPPKFGGIQTLGLADMVDEETFEATLRAFAAAPADDRLGAARLLLRSLLDPLAARAGKPTWLEKTPFSVMVAPFLATLFPQAKFIHVVRDGRDVAVSLAKMPWGSDSAREFLERWANRLRRIDAAVREVPQERVLTLLLEDLTLLDREGSYGRLLAFLGIREEPEVRAFFENEVTAERAHIGRSQAELAPADRSELNDFYSEVLRRLHREDISCAPPERPLPVAFAATSDEPPNPADPWSVITAEGPPR